MMKLTLLMIPATLLARLTVQSAQVSGVVMPQVVPRQRLRVCGKDFIRIVAYSCGASRTKRASMQDEMKSPVLDSANTELVQTDSNKVLKTVQLQSAQDPKLIQIPMASDFPQVKYARRKHTQPSQRPDANPLWKDFFDMYKNYEKHISFSQDDTDELSKDQTKVTSPMEPDFPRIEYQRNRETFMDPRQIEERCCQEGCDYKEIQSLC